jgi:DNA anti-recombination protein RmuC
MDYDLRIGKIEATLEANQNNINNLRTEMRDGFARQDLAIKELRQYVDHRFSELDHKIDDLRRHTDQRIDELQKHADQRIDELRKHTDQRLDELRRHTDQRFTEIRQEMRWMMGVWLTTLGLVASMAGRMFGLY